MVLTGGDLVSLVGAIGAAIVAIYAGYGQALKIREEVRAGALVLREQLASVQGDVATLKSERDSLKTTLEQQTQTLADQSARLTTTIQQLTKISLERDEFARQVVTLTQENEAIKRENAVLQRRIDELTNNTPAPPPAPEHDAPAPTLAST